MLAMNWQSSGKKYKAHSDPIYIASISVNIDKAYKKASKLCRLLFWELVQECQRDRATSPVSLCAYRNGQKSGYSTAAKAPSTSF